jgi:hypothetical protein
VWLTAPDRVLFIENVCIFTATAKAEKIWGVEYLILLPCLPPFRTDGPFHAWNIPPPPPPPSGPFSKSNHTHRRLLSLNEFNISYCNRLNIPFCRYGVETEIAVS